MDTIIILPDNAGCSKAATFVEELKGALKTKSMNTVLEICDTNKSSYADITNKIDTHKKMIFLWSTPAASTPKLFSCAVEYAFISKNHTCDVTSLHVELEAGAAPEHTRLNDDVLLYADVSMVNVLHRITGDSLTAGGHLAFGLAWTFAIGYLMKIANGFSDGVKTASESCINLSNKLIVIIPKSGICPGKVVGCEPTGQSIERFMDVGGVTGRSYKHSVYAVPNPKDNTQIVHAALEYATPVRALHKISEFPSVLLPQQWLQQQVSTFSGLLRDIVQQYRLSDMLCILDYEDEQYKELGAAAYSSNDHVQKNMQTCIYDAARK